MPNDHYEAEQSVISGPKGKVRADSIQFFKFDGKSEVDPQKLAKDLEQLRAAVRQVPDVDPDERDRAVAALLAAQDAATEGDEVKVRANLKRVGKWVLNVAESIGVGVAIAVLRQVVASG
ncbi:hypothetical protein EV652_10371 [Kribbella steppae]|uniref:Uncharacterized protein n=1 Tax=Kribbella steppae TaxID=2512223 RepID=A0A4R2HPI6_9ACTN|nr:hypothetical protein [Kribbella steppae]TCO33072.1 hypothetical protein EV652_10371 [Kribbella steppae]